MKKYLSKKLLIIVAIITVASAGIIYYTTKSLKDKKTPTETSNIQAKKLQTLRVLDSDDEATAANAVKENIVKIINKCENGTIIGTGFFNEDGYLITNSHVVDITGTITIEYYDKTTASATVISNDITSDVALLYVEDPKVLALPFANTMNLNITNTVLSLGYAYNLEGEASVTKGILSARRSAAGVEYLQTDAAVSNGSSGGPLINAKAELVGMNSLASDNASIGIAISSESLINIIYKLTSDKKITYIESERPQNALSIVLTEVGYKTEDLYNEKKHLPKKEDSSNKNNNSNNDNNNNNSNNSNHTNNNNNNSSNNNNSQNNSTEPASNVNTLKFLTIKNYSIPFEEYRYDYEVILINKETSLDITVVPTDIKATYKINGTSNLKEGENIIEIIVTSENKTMQKYTIKAIRPLTKIDRVSGILTGLDTAYSSTLKTNCFKIFWDFIDSDGIRLYPEYASDLHAQVIVDVYAGWSANDGLIDSNGKDLRFLKTFTFTPTMNQFEIYMPINDIRALLKDEEYEGGSYEGADLTFKVKVITKSMGTFSNRNPWGLPK